MSSPLLDADEADEEKDMSAAVRNGPEAGFVVVGVVLLGVVVGAHYVFATLYIKHRPKKVKPVGVLKRNFKIAI